MDASLGIDEALKAGDIFFEVIGKVPDFEPVAVVGKLGIGLITGACRSGREGPRDRGPAFSGQAGWSGAEMDWEGHSARCAATGAHPLPPPWLDSMHACAQRCC